MKAKQQESLASLLRTMISEERNAESFDEHILKAGMLAREDQLGLLGKALPDHVEVVRAWKKGDLDGYGT